MFNYMLVISSQFLCMKFLHTMLVLCKYCPVNGWFQPIDALSYSMELENKHNNCNIDRIISIH